MSRLAASFVLGYHGCDLDVARELVTRRAALVPSDKIFDWLGPGVYFWEADPLRALEWARARFAAAGTPAVVGAVIDLGNCLDLLSRADQELLRGAYDSLAAIHAKAERPLPRNENSPRGGDTDRRLRKLDCAVIRHLHELTSEPAGDVLPFDTVRGMFTEGEQVYEGSGFHAQSHVQIAVLDPACIKGVFLPPELGQTV